MTLNVTYIVEHPSRELRTCRKIHSDLFPHLDFKFLLFPFEIFKIYSARPNIIILPNAKKLYKHLAAIFPNATFIILNLEQQINQINIDQIVSTQSERTIVCSWSKNFSAVLMEKGFNHIVEMPKLDYVCNDSCKLNAKAYDIFVGLTDLHAFIEPSQSIANYNQTVDISVILERYKSRASWARANIESLVKYIAAEIPKYSLSVVLKPHPLVSVDDYKAMFSRLKLRIPDNLEFSNMDAKELVKQSRVLVTNYSSLAIDARLEGKSVWSWLPTPTPDFMSLEWLSFVPKLGSKFNLLELDKEQDLPNLDEYIKQNYLLNRNTYKRRLKAILNSLESTRVKRRFPVSQLRLMAYFIKLYVMGRLTFIPANRQQDFDAAHFLRGTEHV